MITDIIRSETELLDVAPIDFFASMSKEFIEWLPPQFVSDDMKTQAIDVAFHWVNEKGGVARLTSGLQILATVRLVWQLKWSPNLTMHFRIASRIAHHWMSY